MKKIIPLIMFTLIVGTCALFTKYKITDREYAVIVTNVSDNKVEAAFMNITKGVLFNSFPDSSGYKHTYEIVNNPDIKTGDTIWVNRYGFERK